MNLGIVKAGLKKSSEAERCYFTALTHRKKYPDCLYNLGNLVSIKSAFCNLAFHSCALMNRIARGGGGGIL